jgi:Crp-like helix-turn-helix domain
LGDAALGRGHSGECRPAALLDIWVLHPRADLFQFGHVCRRIGGVKELDRFLSLEMFSERRATDTRMGSGQKVELKARPPWAGASVKSSLRPLAKRICSKLITFWSSSPWKKARIEEDLIAQLFNSSEKRLARLLLLLANFGKEGRPEPIVGKFSQETLAEMIGTTRSRISFSWTKFRKLGFIEYNGKLEVHNSLLNVVLHDKPEIKTRDEAIGAE